MWTIKIVICTTEKKMNFKTLSAVILGLSLSFSSFSDFNHVFEKKDWMVKVSKHLNLTDKQEIDIKKISEDTGRDVKKYQEDFFKIQANINTDFTNNTLTDQKKSEYIDEELKIIKEIIDLKLKERMDIYKQLTPEQQKMFSERVNKWIKEHQQ